MPSIIDKARIEHIIAQSSPETLLQYIEQAFVSYSLRQAVVPPVGTLRFEHPPGEVHIKYGYIQGESIYVIKIASGFYENPSLGLSSSNGVNLVFNQTTGVIETILLDEGYLTDIRTAVAGAVVAKYLAPPKISCIGIIGTGIQARLQLTYLRSVVDCQKAMVWGRSSEHLKAYQTDMQQAGFEIETTFDSDKIAQNCSLIVTTTPAKSPILRAEFIQPGTLVTAMGADTVGKQELEPEILTKATTLYLDSKSQCQAHGEIHTAYQKGLLHDAPMVEIGDMISQGGVERDPEAILVADLTGIATQDIQISKYILDNIRE